MTPLAPHPTLASARMDARASHRVPFCWIEYGRELHGMEIDPRELSPRESYRLLTACLIPRPICWVSTRSVDAVDNLAPFSFFGGVTSAPPTVALSVGRRRGVPKDTARNLLDTGEGVVHIPHRPLAEAMVETSAEEPPAVDEFTLAELVKAPAARVRAPRVARAPIALEVVRRQHLEVGDGPVDLFLLEIVYVHIADELLVEGVPDAARTAAVGRLGGSEYCDTRAPFAIARPVRRRS